MPGIFDTSYPFVENTGNDLTRILRKVMNPTGAGTINQEFPGLNSPVVDYSQGLIKSEPVDAMTDLFQATGVQRPEEPASVQPVQPFQQPQPVASQLPQQIKMVDVGKNKYSENNPYLERVKTSFLGIPVKMSTRWHEKAQQWEDRERVRRQQDYNLQRQMDQDQFNRSKFVTVTPELLKQLDPGVAEALKNTPYIDASQLDDIMKISAANQKTAREQAAWKGMQFEAEEALSKIPDDTPGKMGIIAQMEQAIRMQDYGALDKANTQARNLSDSLSKQKVNEATVDNKKADTDQTTYITENILPAKKENIEVDTEGKIIDNTIIKPLTAVEKKARINQINTQAQKNLAQLSKIRSGSSSAKKSKLVDYLHKRYQMYCAGVKDAINNGADIELKDFNSWVKSQNFSNGQQTITGDQMLAQYNQELVNNVDLTGMPEPAPKSGPKYIKSNRYSKGDWDYIDKEVRSRGSVRKTIIDLLPSGKVSRAKKEALAARFGMSLDELAAWYKTNVLDKKK